MDEILKEYKANEIIAEYVELMSVMKRNETRKKELKALLDKAIVGSGGHYSEAKYNATYKVIYRKGSLDPDKLIASDLDPDDYRGPTIEVKKLHVAGNI